MCLAVPGKIVSVQEDVANGEGASPHLRMGKVDFGGVLREVSLAFVPQAGIGDYVIVHVGFALSQVDPEEAEKVFDYVRQLSA